jgi:hypothetical protein
MIDYLCIASFVLIPAVIAGVCASGHADVFFEPSVLLRSIVIVPAVPLLAIYKLLSTRVNYTLKESGLHVKSVFGKKDIPYGSFKTVECLPAGESRNICYIEITYDGMYGVETIFMSLYDGEGFLAGLSTALPDPGIVVRTD